MWSRRGWMSALAGSVWGRCPDEEVRSLTWAELPVPSRRIALDLGLTADRFAEFVANQRSLLGPRVLAGTAEHLTYYLLQSRLFTDLPPQAPLLLAQRGQLSPDSTTLARMNAFTQSSKTPLDARHGLLIELFAQLPPEWRLEACYRHTLRFLMDRLKQSGDRDSVDALYQRRGLSSDSAPANATSLEVGWRWLKTAPRNVLLVGPGLDLTRREGFSDDLPLAQPQFDRLVGLAGPQANLYCVDVRPEVMRFLRQKQRCGMVADVTHQLPSGVTYDAVIATNVLVYGDERSLFTSLAVLSRVLRPGGILLHNDVRFAATVFGRVLDLPVEKFAPVPLGSRNGVELMDRVVLHRKAASPTQPPVG
jgi:hypothetical protein